MNRYWGIWTTAGRWWITLDNLVYFAPLRSIAEEQARSTGGEVREFAPDPDTTVYIGPTETT